MPKRTAKLGSVWMAGLLAAMLCLALTATISPANAQERLRRPTLLDMIFGTRKPALERPQPDRQPRAPRKRTTRSVTTISTPPEPLPAVVEKLPDARSILVVGDFFAGGLADGLAEAFTDAPGVTVVGRSNGSSGLVRDDYYDWKAQLPLLLDEIKPSVVVVAIGANDRQQMTSTTNREKFRTDEWFAEYRKRVADFAALALQRKLPLLWVGIPAFKSPSMTADAIKLNGIYRSVVETAGGEFIDVWDGFVDQDGRFIVTGSDINGQQVRLRGADGIGLTAAGKRKYAFYAEKPVRRHIGDMATPGLLRLDASNLPELISLPPSGMSAIVRTQPIDLSDPELDGGKTLLGGRPPAASVIPSPRDRLVKNGEVSQAPAGRVDDFVVLRTGSATR
ncbi:MAG: GDSL-type esterase/lipase family protein [Allorhizobium sp.]